MQCMAIGWTLAEIINCDFVFHWLCRCVATVTIAYIRALSELNVTSCFRWFRFKRAALTTPKTPPLSTAFVFASCPSWCSKCIFENPKQLTEKNKKTCTLQILSTVTVCTTVTSLVTSLRQSCVQLDNAEVLFLVIISWMSDNVEQEEWHFVFPRGQWRRHGEWGFTGSSNWKCKDQPHY